MTLFSYDHCPYCVKARMIFGLKDIPVEVKTLLNDDEETPITLIGKKMLPILVKNNNEALPESLDIIAYVDGLSEFGEPIVKASRGNEMLKQWLQDVRNYHYALAMPRWVKMELPEFATSSAIQYFTHKKENSIGPFAENLQKTSDLLAQANDHLLVLEDLISEGPYFWGDELTLDDFHVFSSLRCLTTTKGVKFPGKIDRYMNNLSEKANVPLHWDRALGDISHG